MTGSKEQNSLAAKKKFKRHSINLNQESKRDRRISLAFKLWAGAYALAMLAGIGLATSPAHSNETATPSQVLTTASANNTASPQLVRPADMQSGAFLFASKETGRYIEAPKVATDYKIDISGPIARAIVTQKFLNPSDSWLEGLYVFPLPEDAAVDHLRMKIGDREIEGVIKPKQEARALYEKAKRDGKKASLLEQNRPNIFTNSVANIGPGETITVQIEYQQTIPRKDDTFSLRLPLVVAPRYNPRAPVLKPIIELDAKQRQGKSGWGSIDPVPDRDAIISPIIDPNKEAKSNPVTISVKLDAGFPLETVKSLYHKVSTTKETDTSRQLSLTKEAVPADKDFVLTWNSKKGQTPNLGLFLQKNSEKDPNAYLLAYLTPPYKLAENLKMPAREVIFVLDQSGSMEGPSIRQAKASLIEALKQLAPTDSFQIIRFNNEMARLFAKPQAAHGENIETAINWVRTIHATGGTEMAPAMRQALIDHNPNADTLRQVIFLTDGAIGNEKQLFEIVKADMGRSRIFTIGIGSAPNSYFMTRAAEVGRGTFTHIGDIGEVKQQMGKLFTQLTKPVATDLSIDLPNASGIDISPSRIPDLYLGEPLVIAIKAKQLGKTLSLKGRFDNQPWSMSIDLANAAKSNAVDKLWARGKIRQLEGDRLLSNNPNSLDKRIETLGIQHHLVTRLTSLVAIDVTPSRPHGEKTETQKVPLNLPDGWTMDEPQLDAVARAPNQLMAAPAPMAAMQAPSALQTKRVAAFASKSKLLARKPAPTNTGAMPGQPTTGTQNGIMLPKTATLSNLLLLTGIALLGLAGALLAYLQWRKIKSV